MKVTKKLLAVLLCMTMLLSMNVSISFATDAVYSNGEEVTIQISNSTDPSYLVSESGAATWTSVANIKNVLAVYSIPLPALGDNQAVKSFKFKYSIAGQYPGAHALYNLPGEWVPSAMKLADTDSVRADSSNIVDTSDITSATNANYTSATTVDFTADITSFAQKAYDAGQTHVYMGVMGSATISAFSTKVWSGEVNMGLYPTYTFVLKPSDDDSVYENGAKQTVQISNSSDPCYLVSSSGSATWKSRTAFNGSVAVFRIPLPKVGKYQTIKEFEFKYTVTHQSGGILSQAYNLPGSWDMTALNLTDISAQLTEANLAADTVSTVNEGGFSWPTHDVTVDITSFAIKALENGESYVYMGVTTTNATQIFSTVVYSSEAGYGLYPMYSFTLDAYDTLAVMSVSPADGATNVALDSKIVFSFNNSISFATVIINGEEALCDINANEVTVNYDFEEYTDYTVEIGAIDKFNQTATSSLAFSTGAAVSVSDLTNGSAYYITDSADPELFAMTLKLCRYNDSGFNGFGLYVLPVPEVEKGYKLSSYVLAPYSTNTSVYALKFAGENWNLASDADAGITGMRYSDANVKSIIDDWYVNKGASQYNAADSKTSGTDRVYIDITSYMNECIAKGQEYCYVGLISEWTAQLYGFRTGNTSSSMMSYGLSYSWDVDDAIIVDGSDDDYATVNHISELTAGGSYKAVAPYVNLQSDNAQVTLVLAQYNSSDKLIGIIYADDTTLNAKTESGYIVTDAVTLDNECKYVKAFIWNCGSVKPTGVSAVSEVK